MFQLSQQGQNEGQQGRRQQEGHGGLVRHLPPQEVELPRARVQQGVEIGVVAHLGLEKVENMSLEAKKSKYKVVSRERSSCGRKLK